MTSHQDTRGPVQSDEMKSDDNQSPPSHPHAPKRKPKKLKLNLSSSETTAASFNVSKNPKRKRVEFTDIIKVDINNEDGNLVTTVANKSSSNKVSPLSVEEDLNGNNPPTMKKPKNNKINVTPPPIGEEELKPDTMLVVSDSSDVAEQEDKKNINKNSGPPRNRATNRKNSSKEKKGAERSKQNGVCRRCSMNHSTTCPYSQESIGPNEIKNNDNITDVPLNV